MELFKNEALKLSVEAVRNIPNFEELKNEITHIISVTCTGLYAPGLDIELMQALKLHPTTQRTSINFMGCNAAILALKQAHEICEKNDSATVLIVCTELCTIHFQRQFTDDYIVSNCLFADGSAAALVSSKCKTISPLSKPLKIESFNSLVAHEGSSDMAWQVTETGFMMKLTPYVSSIINKHLPDLLTVINDESINKFVIHPGGKKILDECLKTLSLTKTDLQESYETLEQYGNMSSPTILFALKKYVENSKSSNHQTICALGFGPGLSIESARFTHV
jgi:predicted naringenin-chalcone synthase